MKSDVFYALTRDGEKLPILDVTNPAFAVTATDAELAALSDQYIRESTQMREMPPTLREALQASMFGKALMAASGSYLPGMITYRLKLGPDNQGKDASPIDRRIAASFPAFASRIRVQDMAELLADGIAHAEPGGRLRSICLMNIAGGAASDSWNALICLQAKHASLLGGREVVIAVFETAEDGPVFGARAIEMLRGTGAPLSRLQIGFHHIQYAWCEVEGLRRALEDLNAVHALSAISSEGGLFEYGSDAEIVSNLRVLHTGTACDAFVVGSVTRDGEVVRASQIANRISTLPRTIEAFRSLSEEAGWRLQTVIERPFSYNVRLVKMQG